MPRAQRNPIRTLPQACHAWHSLWYISRRRQRTMTVYAIILARMPSAFCHLHRAAEQVRLSCGGGLHVRVRARRVSAKARVVCGVR